MHVPTQNKEDIIKSGSHQGFSPTPQSKLRKETSSRKNHASKYENSFNGYFYVCNDFDHKELDCTSHAKSVGTPNNTVRCWKCNYVVHIAANCHTMICYNFYGFGHKAQDCASSGRKPMMSPSYTLARKTHEPWKKNNAGRFEAQKTCVQVQRHSQVWVYKNVLLNVNEVDQCTKYGCHMASQA